MCRPPAPPATKGWMTGVWSGFDASEFDDCASWLLDGPAPPADAPTCGTRRPTMQQPACDTAGHGHLAAMRCSLLRAPPPPATAQVSPFREASQHAMAPPAPAAAAALSRRQAGLPLSQSAPAAAMPQLGRSDGSGALSSAALSWAAAFSRLAEEQGCAAPDPFGGSWKQGPGIVAPRSPVAALECCPAAESSAATVSPSASACGSQPQDRTVSADLLDLLLFAAAEAPSWASAADRACKRQAPAQPRLARANSAASVQQQRGLKRSWAGGPGAEDAEGQQAALTEGQQAMLHRLNSARKLLLMCAAQAAQKEEAAAARPAAIPRSQPLSAPRRAMSASAPAASSGEHVLPIVGPVPRSDACPQDSWPAELYA